MSLCGQFSRYIYADISFRAWNNFFECALFLHGVTGRFMIGKWKKFIVFMDIAIPTDVSHSTNMHISQSHTNGKHINGISINQFLSHINCHRLVEAVTIHASAGAAKMRSIACTYLMTAYYAMESDLYSFELTEIGGNGFHTTCP